MPREHGGKHHGREGVILAILASMSSGDGAGRWGRRALRETGDRVGVADPDGEAPAAVRRSSCRKVNLLINIGIGTEADPQILSKVHV